MMDGMAARFEQAMQLAPKEALPVIQWLASLSSEQLLKVMRLSPRTTVDEFRGQLLDLLNASPPLPRRPLAVPAEHNQDTVERGFRLVLEGIGVDLTDPHFQDTPRRAAKAWFTELCRGVTGAPPELRTFPMPLCDQMVMLRRIPIRSLCAHHLLPFVGEAVVAYIPSNGQVLGLSKLSRITDYCARRPQTQEQLTQDIADMVAEAVLDPAAVDFADESGTLNHQQVGGVGVLIRATHMCMQLRGVNHAGDMVTSVVHGIFKSQRAVREEFLHLAKE